MHDGTQNPVKCLFRKNIIVQSDEVIDELDEFLAIYFDMVGFVQNTRYTVKNHARRWLVGLVYRFENKVEEQLVDFELVDFRFAIDLIENMNNGLHEDTVWHAVKTRVETQFGIN